MTQTLRRERKQKFRDVVLASELYFFASNDPEIQKEDLNNAVNTLCELLADASKSRREIAGEYKLPANSDPAFLMAVGQDITSEAQKERQIENDAILAFESSFSARKPLLWYCGKPKWTQLRKDVVELYKADPQCFEKYKVWRMTSYVKGAVSLRDVQRDPDCFMASWAGFTEAQPKQEAERPEYKKVKPVENKEFVPFGDK